MEASKINEYLANGKMVIEDIKEVIKPDLWPLIDQINFYFQKYTEHINSGSFEEHVHLDFYLKNSFRQEFEALLLLKNNLKNVNFNFAKNLNISFWNKFFNLLEEYKKLIELVQNCTYINFIFSLEGVRISVEDCDVSIFPKNSFYELIHRFAEKDVLFTARFENEKLINFESYFGNESQQLVFDKINQELGISLSLNEICKNFLMDYSKIESIGRTTCIEITKDFELSRYNNIPRKYLELLQEGRFTGTILYFPFLFESISLIIPSKGKVINYNQQIGNIVTGSEVLSKNTIFRSGLFENSEEIFYFLNILSLFSKF